MGQFIHPCFLVTAIRDEVDRLREKNLIHNSKRIGFPNLDRKIVFTRREASVFGFVHPSFLIAALIQAAESIRKNGRDYHQTVKHQRREKSAAYRLLNRDKIKSAKRKYRLSNLEKVREGQKRCRVNNRDKFLKWQADYRSRNKDKIAIWARRYGRKVGLKKLADPAFRLRSDLVAAMSSRLTWVSKIEDALGCSIADFKVQIEGQFAAGMSWENRSLWNLDHIFPVSACGRKSDLVYKSFKSRNIRPEWRLDNIRKSDKVTVDGIISARDCGINVVYLRKPEQIDADARRMALDFGMTIVLTGGRLNA